MPEHTEIRQSSDKLYILTLIKRFIPPRDMKDTLFYALLTIKMSDYGLFITLYCPLLKGQINAY